MSISIDYRAKYNEKCDELAYAKKVSDLAHSKLATLVDEYRTLKAGRERLESRLVEALKERDYASKKTEELKANLVERSRISDEYLAQVHRLCAELNEAQTNPSPAFAGPVPTSGEILRLFTEACMDPTSEVRGPLEDAYAMALRREQTAAKVEDFLGKEGAERLAEQVAQLVKGKLTEKERLTEKANNAEGRDREQRFRELNDWNRRNPAPVQPSGPRLELEHHTTPFNVRMDHMHSGAVYLDGNGQPSIKLEPVGDVDCCWFNPDGVLQAAREGNTQGTVIGQLKAVYPAKESK